MVERREILSTDSGSSGTRQSFDQMVKPIAFGLSISVNKGHNLPGSSRDPGVTSCRKPAMREGNDACAIIGGDSCGFVRRTVIDDDYFLVGVFAAL